MTTLYNSQSISGYNSNPPPDDGSTGSDNEISWSKHKDKLGDPVKTLSEAINTELGNAFGRVLSGGGTAAKSTPYQVVAGDQGVLLITTSAITVTTPAAGTVGSPFVFAVLNTSSSQATIDGNADETVNGGATFTLEAGEGVIVFTDGSNWFAIGKSVPALPKNYLSGLTLSNNSGDAAHDIDVAVGECRSAGDTANMALSSVLTKQINANWSSGDDAGGFPSGLTLAADTWYHVFVVDETDGTIDAGFDTSLTATNLLSDTGGSEYRRVGSVLTDSSSNILGFTQNYDEFLWDDPPLDIDKSLTTTASTEALSVPTGVSVRAMLNVRNTDGQNVYLSSPDVDDEAPSATAAPLSTVGTGGAVASSQVEVWTNTSSQIRGRSDATNAIRAATLGWRDQLGR